MTSLLTVETEDGVRGMTGRERRWEISSVLIFKAHFDQPFGSLALRSPDGEELSAASDNFLLVPSMVRVTPIEVRVGVIVFGATTVLVTFSAGASGFTVVRSGGLDEDEGLRTLRLLF